MTLILAIKIILKYKINAYTCIIVNKTTHFLVGLKSQKALKIKNSFLIIIPLIKHNYV